MADNLSIESPDFDKIRKESGYNTSDAIKLLWYALNNEIDLRRQTVKVASDTDSGKILTDSPSTSQNNYDTMSATTVYFTGGTAFDLSGFRNPVEGRRVMVHNIGVGTVTLKHNSSSSDTPNRFILSSGADQSLTTNTSALFTYMNSLWREFKSL